MTDDDYAKVWMGQLAKQQGDGELARLRAELAACKRDRAKMARDLIEADAKLAKARDALRPFASFELWTDAYPDGPLEATTWDRRVNPAWVSDARVALEEISEAAVDTIGALRLEVSRLTAELDALRAVLAKIRRDYSSAFMPEDAARIDAALKGDDRE